MVDLPKLHLMRRELYIRADWMLAGVTEPPERVAYIKRHNLKVDEIEAYAGLFAVCLCIFPGKSNTTGLPCFYFCPDGEPSAVVEVLDEDGKTVLDLLAWPLAEPEAFSTAIGNADIVGASNMRSVLRCPYSGPLLVHRTPHDWFLGDCKGCVILNPKYAGYWFRRFCNRDILVEDMSHGRDLKTMLRQEHKTRTPLPEFDMKRLLVPAHCIGRAA